MGSQPNSQQQNDWYLRKADIKKALTEKELAWLYQQSSRTQMARGEILWLDDDEDRTPKIYIVDKGYARICKTSDEGKRFIVAILGPGEFFGALSPDLQSSELEEYLEVIRDMRLIAIEAEAFHQILQTHPAFSLRLVNIVENRKRTLEKRISSMLFKDVTARTAEFLVEICNKYAEECPNAPGVFRDIPLTHQEIADIVGATRPVVSGIISSLIKAGLMDKHGRSLCLNNLAKMTVIAEQGIKALSPSPLKD